MPRETRPRRPGRAAWPAARGATAGTTRSGTRAGFPSPADAVPNADSGFASGFAIWSAAGYGTFRAYDAFRVSSRTTAGSTAIWLRKPSRCTRPTGAGQTAMSYATIQFHPGPRVASIVLNRPPLNIINLEMLDELNAAWTEVEELKGQVAVISAAGDRAFSAGVHVGDHMPGKIETMIDNFHRFVLRIRKSECITIAAIHGHTLGGGAELAMMCDLVFASSDTQIGQPEIS